MTGVRTLVVVVLAAFLATPSAAHNVGESYLYLQIRSDAVSGRFEVALSDLNHTLGFEGTADEITAENFEARVDFLKSYYLDNVSILRGDQELRLQFTEHRLMNAHGGFATLSFDLPQLDGDVPDILTFDYSVLLDEAHQHRGFLLVESNWATGTFANENQISLVFERDDRRKDFELKTDGRWRGFVAVVGLGIEHIWEGIDHILFLVALLLPAVLRRDVENGRREWRPVERFTPAFVHVVKIVTAFTVAHSVTLSLAALGVIELPGALVETVIAASIAIAAADLLVPIFRGRLWMVVVGFGLFHGFGFAGALSEMGVLGEHKVLSLLAFNLGVEIGQVCIVAVLVPVLFLVRRPTLYRKVALPAAAVFLIAVSGVWVAERAFGVDVPMYESLPPAIQKFVP
ncbi:MAG: HupE/UreJ family protein [Thermoanaerobaculia bacterium]|nr:HupE/UreJ family protein [Thermoanaerobaculia bacterium]